MGLDEHRLLLGLESRDRAALRARPGRRGGFARRPGSLGPIVSAAGAGSLVGDAVALVARPRRPLVPGYLALASCGLAPALLARPFPTAVVAVASAVGFAALSFSNAVWSTTLQDRIPRRSLSRVSAYDWLGSRLFQPLGYALAGPAGAAIGIPATLLAGAALRPRRALWSRLCRPFATL